MSLRAVMILACVCTTTGVCADSVSIGPYEREEFFPGRGRTFDIPLMVREPATVRLDVMSPDGDPVRALGDFTLQPGRHVIGWDGKDDRGEVVPDEAYFPSISLLSDGAAHRLSNALETGGEVIDDIEVRITPDKHISYTLPAPSRVLIRAGIKGGPMLRSLAYWAPRPSGKNVQRWNGFDQDNLIDIRNAERLSVLVTAFRLPRDAIIVTGNEHIDYKTYRTERGLTSRLVEPDQMVLERDGKRISRHHYFSRATDFDPRVELSLPAGLPASQDGVAQVTGPIDIKVDIPRADRWSVEQSLFEVGFFVDHEFISEEEQGYVPLTWRWSANGLTPGRHVLTVNISGFRGQVGVKSVLFDVP